jgi:hypothetical protein
MKFLKYTFFTLFVLVLLFAWLFPQFLRCFFVEYDSFQEIKPNIFVEEKTSKMQQDSLLKYVESAEKRIESFWGCKNGQAKIIFCKKTIFYYIFFYLIH